VSAEDELKNTALSAFSLTVETSDNAEPQEGPMHAVFVTATIQDYEKAREELHARVIPTVSQAPGFVTGYWLAPQDGRGNSVIVFDSEDAAQAAADRLEPPSEVTLDSVEVREVAGHA
jgi:hypothetical protein